MDNNYDNFLKTVPNGEPANIGGYNRYKLVHEFKIPIVSFYATTNETTFTVTAGYFDQSGEYRQRGAKVPLPVEHFEEAAAVRYVMQAIERDEREARFANAPTIPPIYDLHPTAVAAPVAEPDTVHGLEKRICKALGLKRVDFTYFAKTLPSGWISIEYTGSNGMNYTLTLHPETGEGV